MSTVKQDVVSDLKEITLYCRDSAVGYHEAAQKVRETYPSYAQRWEAFSAVRHVYVEQLNERLMCIGEDRKESGSTKGAIHRGIIALKDIFSSNDLQAATKECIRGEEELLESINHTLEDDTLDGATRSLLVKISVHVKDCVYELKSIAVAT